MINLKDKLSQHDSIAADALRVKYKHPSPFVRTRIDAVDEFGQVLFEHEENQVVLGGSLFTLEKIFGITSPLKVDYLNDIKNIANSGPINDEIYPKDNLVCLFGVGIGGCGDSYKSVLDVNFHEREIFDMVPFRISNTLPPDTESQYWFRESRPDGKKAYYLKKFDTKPVIKVLWRDAEGDQDGSEVQEGVHNTDRKEPIETFVELMLNIDKEDIREYFESVGEIEQARINSIGLFTGVLGDVGNGEQDYKQVKMFSKLNIPNEMLTIVKSFRLSYRIYGS